MYTNLTGATGRGRWLTITPVLLMLACGGGRESLPSQAGDQAEPPPQGQWLAGDLHVHSDHSSDGSGARQLLDQRGPANVSVADQIAQGVRAGLDWMPITDHRTYNQHYDPLWESAELLLIPGEEANGSPHANPIGAVDTIVQGGVPEGRPDWSRVQTSIWDAHAQDAVWSHNHPDDGFVNDDGSANERASAVGYQLMEVWNKASDIDTELLHAEDRWNRGFRFSGVGASDNHFRELWLVAGPGNPTTRVFGHDHSERAILQGLAAGRVSISARGRLAPALRILADFDGEPGFEAMGGDEIIAAPGQSGRLRIEIDNGLGARLDIYRNPGRAAGPWQSLNLASLQDAFEIEIEADGSAQWFYAELRGPGELDSVNNDALGNPLVLLQPDTGLNERRALSAPIFIGPDLAQPQPEQALPADASRPDNAQTVLGETGRFSGFPDVAVDGGVIHVVAEQHGEGATRIVYRRIDEVMLAAVQILSGDSRSARFARIAAQGDQVWVVWQDERAGQVPRRPAIVLRHSTDGGRSWQAEQVVRGFEGRAEKPALALRPDGRPVVVWQEIAAGRAFDVMAQVIGEDAEPVNLSATGKTIQPFNLIDTRSAFYPASIWPAVAVAADGSIAVAFQDNRFDPDPGWTSNFLTGEDGATEVDDYQIAVVTRRPGADWAEPRFIGSASRLDAHPALAFDNRDHLIAVWDSKEQRASGANTSIRYSVSTDFGQNWSAAQEPPALAEDAQYMSQYPRLGVDADGRVRAVWYDSRHSDWRWKIMSARWDGDAWTDARLLDGAGVNTWPATAGSVIVFSSTRNASRVQRDPTQQIMLLRPGTP